MSVQEDYTDIILSGRLTEIPQLPKSSLNIYLCSNRSDFELERYHLWRDALPALQQHCIQYGLDVVWTDVHYGSEIDHVKDAYRFEHHVEEIEQCNQQSVGPFFVCLIGNKYGDCPLPTYLDEKEFQHIRNEAFESGKDIKLLDDWYCKDYNSVPVVYRLQHITDRYPNHDVKSHINYTGHKTDTQNWEETYTALLNLIQYGADVAHKEGNINVKNNEKQERFYTSGLEREITAGLKLAPNGCVLLERNIESINTGVVGATAYVDLAKNIAIDLSKQAKLRHLKHQIKQEVIKGNHFEFNISWTECDNIHKVIEQHGEYMENFLAAVTTKLVALVDIGLQLQYNVDKATEPLCSDIHVHLKHCRQLMMDYSISGFEKLLLSVQNLMFAGRTTDHQPILITGSSGCGMSSFISKLCHHGRDIFGKDTILIVRYVGLTPQSCNGVKLLKQICTQLNCVLQQNIDLRPYDICHLTSYFHGLINRISKTSKNLVIAIDDIDKLQGDLDEPSYHDWLLTKLPPKVHMIISYHKTEQANIIIEKLERKNDFANSIIYFPNWSLQQYSVLLNKKLSKMHRSLNKDQESAILKILQHGSVELITIGIDLAGNWTTHFNPTGQSLPSSLTEAIHQKMDSLELTFGLEVIQAVIRHLSVPEFGISEMELLDVLSSNRELMKALDLDNKPICRFPPYLWIALKHELELMLTTTYCHGKQLLVWTNKGISDILSRRYMFLPSVKAQYHLDFARLFLKSEIDVGNNNEMGSTYCVIEPFRCMVCPQPLIYSNVKYNARRINEVWIQLLNGGELSLLKEHAFCNFEYLLALIHSTSIDNAIGILESTLRQVIDPEIDLIHRTLLISRDVLLDNPIQLAVEMISRLRNSKDLYTHHLESLVTQSMAWCDSYNLPLLVPLTSWLQMPRKALVTSIGGMEGSKYLSVLKDNQHLLCTFGFMNIAMYHIPTNRIVRIFSGHRGAITCIQLSHNGTFIVTGSEDGSSRIWKVMEGLCTNIIKEHKRAVSCLALTSNDDQLVTGSHDTCIMIYKVVSGKKMFTLKGHKKAVTCVKLTSAANMLLSGSVDRTIIVWCMEDMVELTYFSDYINSPIRSIDLSIDETFLLVACDDSSLNVISFATGSWIHQLTGHSGWINRVLICEDANHVVAACQNGSVYVYNLRSTELIETFRGTNHAVTDLHLSTDETLIFTCSEGTINVWNLHRKLPQHGPNTVHDSPVTCIYVSDTIAATGSENGTVNVWNLKLNELKDSFKKHTRRVTCLQVSYDCSFVVSGSNDRTLCVWDKHLAVVITCYQEHSGIVQAVTIFPDDSQVISLDCFSNFLIWKPHTGQTLRSYNFPTYLYVLSSKGSHLTVTRGDQSVNVWNLNDKTIITQVNHGDKITCLACSMDDQYIVTGSSDRSLKVWESLTGKITQVLVEHETDVGCVVISEDNEHVVSGAKDGNMIIWKVQTGEIMHKLTGHTDKITGLRLTVRGQLIISGSLDNSLRVWSLQYGEEITFMDLHSHVVSFAMSDDASHIVVQLDKNKHAPILCLHNSPAVENNQLWSPDETKVLPINMKTVSPVFSMEYPVPKLPATRRNDSISSIPQIVKLSPIRAPPSKTKGRRKPGRSTRYHSIDRRNSLQSNHKFSAVCLIL